MSEKKKTRSGQEWLELIRECREGGLPDREWCRLHSISIKTFHNKVSDLRKKSCIIPEPQAVPSRQVHEVVPLELGSSPVLNPGCTASDASPVSGGSFQSVIPPVAQLWAV